MDAIKIFLTEEKKCTEMDITQKENYDLFSGANYLHNKTIHILYKTPIDGLYIILLTNDQIYLKSINEEIIFYRYIASCQDRHVKIKSNINNCLQEGNRITQVKTFLTEEKKCIEMDITNLEIQDIVNSLFSNSLFSFIYRPIKIFYKTSIDGLYIVLVKNGTIDLITLNGEIKLYKNKASCKNSLHSIKKNLNNCLKEGDQITRVKTYLTEEKKCIEMDITNPKSQDILDSLNTWRTNNRTKIMYKTPIDDFYIALLEHGLIYSITKNINSIHSHYQACYFFCFSYSIERDLEKLFLDTISKTIKNLQINLDKLYFNDLSNSLQKGIESIQNNNGNCYDKTLILYNEIICLGKDKVKQIFDQKLEILNKTIENVREYFRRNHLDENKVSEVYFKCKHNEYEKIKKLNISDDSDCTFINNLDKTAEEIYLEMNTKLTYEVPFFQNIRRAQDLQEINNSSKSTFVWKEVMKAHIKKHCNNLAVITISSNINFPVISITNKKGDKLDVSFLEHSLWINMTESVNLGLTKAQQDHQIIFKKQIVYNNLFNFVELEKTLEMFINNNEVDSFLNSTAISDIKEIKETELCYYFSKSEWVFSKRQRLE